MACFIALVAGVAVVAPRSQATAEDALVQPLGTANYMLPGASQPGKNRSGTHAVLSATNAILATATVGARSGFSPGGDFPWLSDADLARELDLMQATGASWVRVDFAWSTIEPTKGQFDWTNVDRVTAAVAERNLKVLALLTYTPAWARPGCSSDKCPPADVDDFANFVGEAARRYGPERVQAWELWNEPNNAAFWSPRPDVDAYAALLRASAAALKRSRPGALVISGGLSPAHSNGRDVAPVPFVGRLYALGAMRGVDAVGIHPYSGQELPLSPGTESWNTFLQMRQVHQVMSAYGDRHKMIWATEFGVSTGTNKRSVTEARQAAVIEQGYARLADGTWSWLATLFTYSLRDQGQDIDDWQSNFGLVRFDGSTKPAYRNFERSMSRSAAW
jgi:hypothetical protein